ncbi:MAG: hypothetical protein AABZ60_18910 [Planctomycetota bacterium]
MSTVSISMLKEITKKVKVPRVLYVPYALGYPLGKPYQVDLQEKILLQALKLLELPRPAQGFIEKEFEPLLS